MVASTSASDQLPLAWPLATGPGPCSYLTVGQVRGACWVGAEKCGIEEGKMGNYVTGGRLKNSLYS
jgi:hypothetical protein